MRGVSGGRRRAGAALVAIGAALATLGGGAGVAHAATCDTSWAAPVDGLFDQAQNWTNGVPTVTDAACLPSFAPAYQVTIRDNRSAAASLSIGGNVSVRLIDGPSGARFQAPGGIQNDGIFDVATLHGEAYDLALG